MRLLNISAGLLLAVALAACARSTTYPTAASAEGLDWHRLSSPNLDCSSLTARERGWVTARTGCVDYPPNRLQRG
jgi:hypothetical protein